ncbi:MAG: acyl carrier protein [Bacteroidetes bacterium]|nr:acyl carrier protein [Bacteroidota bacterium]
MDRTEVENRVKKVIASVLKINEGNISSEANFIFDLGADSLQSLQLVAGFEEEFDIEMDEDAALGVHSVSEAVNFIKTYVDVKV